MDKDPQNDKAMANDHKDHKENLEKRPEHHNQTESAHKENQITFKYLFCFQFGTSSVCAF